MRLTVAKREQILKNVMDATFKKRTERLTKDRQALAGQIYNNLYGKHAKAIAAVPDGFLYRCSEMFLKFGGSVTRLGLGAQHVLPCESRYNTILHHFDHDHDFTKAFDRLDARESKLKKDKRSLKSKVQPILSAATTVKKLTDLWPEGEKFLPVSTGVKNLPAIPIKELNGLLSTMQAD